MSGLVESLNEVFPVAVSTDRAGVIGHPQISVDFWTEVFGDINFGLEILAWRHLLAVEPIFIEQYADRIAGFHGRMGISRDQQPDSPLGQHLDKAFNRLLLYTPDLLDLTEGLVKSLSEKRDDATHFLYALTHQPEAETELIPALPPATKGVVVAVENHVSLGSFGKTCETVARLKNQGYDAVMVFDIVHAMRELPTYVSYKDKWQVMIRELNQLEQCLIHLPIGLNPKDSLDRSKITEKMWEDLAEQIQAIESFVIIEFQLHGLIPLLLGNSRKLAVLVAETQLFIGELNSYGVLSTKKEYLTALSK